jgi:cardiolipin synthase C
MPIASFGLLDNTRPSARLGRRMPLLFLAMACAWLFSGCASVPKHIQRPPSTVILDTQHTALASLVATATAQHEQQSGFYLLNESREAFLSRLALIDMAERSIDAQYYIWKPDLSGSIVVERLARAAQRGVRVRLLIDGLHAGGHDLGIIMLNSHPNIEVRIYNPFGNHFLPMAGRALEIIGNFNRINHRMHNKMLVVDNEMAIIGGRNIADEYFGVHPRYNFRDLDLLMAGAVVPAVSRTFDEYWNSQWAIPLRALSRRRPAPIRFEKACQQLRQYIAKHQEFPYAGQISPERASMVLSGYASQFIWAPAKVIADSPEKTGGGNSQFLFATLDELIAHARHEIMIVTPYFAAPNRQLVGSKLCDCHQRGVTVRMLMNSLASIDSAVSHIGYVKFRHLLVQSGVELFEARPDAASRRLQVATPTRGTVLGQHGKAAIIDRERVFLGTFNLGPRSAYLNTEVGLLIESPELARMIMAAVEVDLRPENAWKVVLRSELGAAAKKAPWPGKLAWITEENGQPKIYFEEPAANCRRHCVRCFWGLFALENQM